MKSRKNKSILRGDSKSRWSSPKGQTALALAILLWIAGGSVVALAQETIVASDYDGSVFGNHDDNGLDNSAGDPNNNQVTVKAGVTVSGTVYGSNKYATTVSGNTVIINGKVTSNVYGGTSGGDSGEAGDVNHNHVTITGMVVGDVYGGRCGGEGNASENEVTVSGGTVGGSIYGGYVYEGDTAGQTLNQVTLKDATVTGAVYGFSVRNGAPYEINNNTLNLSGANTVGGTVGNFVTIKLANTLTWNTAKPVLTANEFSNYGTLDITEATNLANQTEPGTMTLLSSDTDNNFADNFKLAYNSTTQANPVAFSSTKTSQVVKTGANESSAVDGVTLGYNNTHTVAYDSANKAINYTVANNVNKITLGDIAWVKDSTVRDGKDYDFSSKSLCMGWDTVKDFRLTFADDAAYKSLGYGNKMTLVSNATVTTGDAGLNKVYDYTVANGAKLSTNVNGQISTSDNKISLVLQNICITNVDLAKWDSSKAAFAVPDGWKPTNWNHSPVSVTAAGFDTTGRLCWE